MSYLINQLVSQSVTKMFVKQPLASLGSANNLYSYKIDYAAQVYDILNFNKYQSCSNFDGSGRGVLLGRVFT